MKSGKERSVGLRRTRRGKEKKMATDGKGLIVKQTEDTHRNTEKRCNRKRPHIRHTQRKRDAKKQQMEKGEQCNRKRTHTHTHKGDEMQHSNV